MKKFISLLLMFVLLTGCGAKTKLFTPSVENITNLLKEKEIPYTVTGFQHRGSDVVENVVQYSCGLANKYGENIYAMVLAYEGEICHSVTVISMLKTQGMEEAQKIVGFAMDVYGFDEKHIKGFSESIEYDIDMVLTMRDELFERIATTTKSELVRINAGEGNTKASMFYLTVLSETKAMVLQARNLLKAQRYFLEHSGVQKTWAAMGRNRI